MFKGLVLLLLVVLVAGCAVSATSEDVVPDSHITSFSVLCDTGRNVGMYTYAYNRNPGSNASTGYGYAIRMTDAEYERECSRYE